MNTDAFSVPYPRSKQLVLAGCLALVTLATAVTYACHSTPYTMVLFLGGGSFFLVAAVLLFSWTIWRDARARLDSIVMKQFAAGQTIFRQGEPAEHVFVITRGQVEAVYEDPTRGEVVIGRLGPDEFFGETAILSRLPRQATARAVGEVELLAVHRTDFLQLYSSLPRLRARIEARQAHRHALVREAARGNPSK